MPSPLPAAILVTLVALVTFYTFVLRPGALRSQRVRQWERIAGEEAKLVAVPTGGLEQRLRAAGLSLSRRDFILLSLALGLLGGCAALGLGLPPLLALGAAVGAGYLPHYWVSQREQGRSRAADQELPGAIALLVGNLRVQPDLAEALRLTAAALQAGEQRHLPEELLRTAAEMRTLGSEAALSGLQARSPSPALALLAGALALYVQVGGDFLPVLERRAVAIRDWTAARQEAVTSAADALLAGKAIPALLALVTLGLLDDPQFGAFYRSLAGQLVLLLCAAAMLLGYRVMVSMVEEVA
jgi:tight adherence protein B